MIYLNPIIDTGLLNHDEQHHLNHHHQFLHQPFQTPSVSVAVRAICNPLLYQVVLLNHTVAFNSVARLQQYSAICMMIL